MNEEAKGYIKLEIRDGGVGLKTKLEHVGIMEKMALLDAFIEALEMSTEAAMALMMTYVAMAKTGAFGKVKIDLGTIEDMIENNEEEER